MKSICCAIALSASCAGGIVAQDGGRAAIARPEAAHVRVVTWNIGSNSIFPDPGAGRGLAADSGRPERFARIVRALQPDVLCLQEIHLPRTPADLALLLDSIAPAGGERRWNAYGIRDAVIATPYPISMRASREEEWGNGIPRSHAMALVTLPEALGGMDLYVICTHMQSRGELREITARHRHADAIMQWLRELRAPVASGGLPHGTPFVIMGDFNAYVTDPAQHMVTLLTGAISDTLRFGPAFAPDWDGTPLADAAPLHNGTESAGHTFGDGIGPPPPGALDRILYTDSRLALVGGFVLNTTTLDSGTLYRLGLQAGDSFLNVAARLLDHLAVVADLRVRDR
jgi:endonuclease/exonuclease/phosphatase family metal-dependent hydrolase